MVLFSAFGVISQQCSATRRGRLDALARDRGARPRRPRTAAVITAQEAPVLVEHLGHVESSEHPAELPGERSTTAPSSDVQGHGRSMPAEQRQGEQRRGDHLAIVEPLGEPLAIGREPGTSSKRVSTRPSSMPAEPWASSTTSPSPGTWEPGTGTSRAASIPPSTGRALDHGAQLEVQAHGRSMPATARAVLRASARPRRPARRAGTRPLSARDTPPSSATAAASSSTRPSSEHLAMVEHLGKHGRTDKTDETHGARMPSTAPATNGRGDHGPGSAGHRRAPGPRREQRASRRVPGERSTTAPSSTCRDTAARCPPGSARASSAAVITWPLSSPWASPWPSAGNREPARSAGHRRALRGRGPTPAPGRAAPRSSGPSASGSERFPRPGTSADPRSMGTSGDRFPSSRTRRPEDALDSAGHERPR